MAERIVWTCVRCREPIEDGDGHLVVDLAAVQEHERAWDDLHERQRATGKHGVDVRELADMPGHALWEAVHIRCYPESNTYDIAIADMRTHATVIDQTAHMIEKTWIGSTNWPALLRWCARQ